MCIFMSRILAFADAGQGDRGRSLAPVAEEAMLRALRLAGLDQASEIAPRAAADVCWELSIYGAMPRRQQH